MNDHRPRVLVADAIAEPGIALLQDRCEVDVRTGPRVGVSGAGGDATAFPWRFWLPGEPTVSTYRPG